MLQPPPIAAKLRAASRLPLSELLAGSVDMAAGCLLGCRLLRRLPSGELVEATIVETEAYHMREPGCHAFKGRTVRTAVMFGAPGRAYVYFTYGMWHCVNVVCEPEGTAAAVLLRAAESPSGLRLSGPGLLCRGLELTREHNGLDLLDPASPLRLERPDGWTLPPIDWTTRIGFSFPDTYQWRAVWRGHPAVSPGRPGVIVGKKKKTALGEGRSRLESE